MADLGPRPRTTGHPNHVVAVIPWRDKGNADRRANFEYVLDRLLTCDLYEVLVCDDGRTSGPFNRSAAYNAGRAHRPDAAAYLWHEADMVVPLGQMEQGIRLALAAPGLVVPFNTYAYLGRDDSARVLAGEPLAAVGPPEFQMVNGTAVGAVGITSQETMQAVGRWDEHFHGWGYDDRAMARAFEVATGHPIRYAPGYGHHLWHEPGWSASDPRLWGGSEMVPLDERRATEANRRRYRRYKAARHPEQIRALTR